MKLNILEVARALLALGLMVVIGLVFNADGAFFRWSVHRDMLRRVGWNCGAEAPTPLIGHA